jgi:thioesterase domain-containing protein
LALALATDRPVYGINPIQNGKELYRKSVQETAKIYYHNLVDFYPKGPYLLLGHSGRGYFTLELARMLLKKNKHVVFLGLLDTYPPISSNKTNPIDRVKSHKNNLLGKNATEVLRYIKSSLIRFTNRWKSRIVNKREIKKSQEKEQFMNIRYSLWKAYKPKPYAGDVTLFSVSHPDGNPMEQWANTFIGQFDIVTVPGDHVSMLNQPNVASLAEEIKALLPKEKD